MKLKSGHPRHLHVCDHAGQAAAAPGFQKILGGFERHRHKAQRPDEACQSLPDREIVVDDRNDDCPWQFRFLTRTTIDAQRGFPIALALALAVQRKDRPSEQLVAIILEYELTVPLEGRTDAKGIIPEHRTLAPRWAA